MRFCCHGLSARAATSLAARRLRCSAVVFWLSTWIVEGATWDRASNVASALIFLPAPKCPQSRRVGGASIALLRVARLPRPSGPSKPPELAARLLRHCAPVLLCLSMCSGAQAPAKPRDWRCRLRSQRVVLAPRIVDHRSRLHWRRFQRAIARRVVARARAPAQPLVLPTRSLQNCVRSVCSAPWVVAAASSAGRPLCTCLFNYVRAHVRAAPPRWRRIGCVAVCIVRCATATVWTFLRAPTNPRRLGGASVAMCCVAYVCALRSTP